MRRQVIILILVGLIASTAFFIFYTNRSTPSCQDNRRNQKEEGIDCGGPCIPCALRAARPIDIFWSAFVRSRENTYDVAAEIRNPNVKLGAVSLDYEFKLFDTAGVAVARRRGRSFVYPGETAHLVEVGFVSGRTIRSASLTILDVKWVLMENIGPDIIAGNKEYLEEEADGARYSALKAIVTNRALETVKGLVVNALVFDGENNLLGIDSTVIDEILSGQTAPVKFAWPQVFGKPVASLMVEARSKDALASKE